MILTGFTVVILLLTAIARELDLSERYYTALPQHSPPPRQQTTTKLRPPPLPLPTSTTSEVAKYNIHRLTKHLKGEFVFPPVCVEELRSIPEESPVSPRHRRFQTTVGSGMSPKTERFPV